MKRGLYFLVLTGFLSCMAIHQTIAQGINGPSCAPAGVAVHYWYDDGSTYPGATTWVPTNGTVVAGSVSISGTTYSADIIWSLGSGNLAFNWKSNNLANLAVSSPFTLYDVGGGGTRCTGSSFPAITLSGSQVGITYNLYYVNTGATPNGGGPTAGTGGALTWNLSSVVIGQQINIRATHAASGCIIDMNGQTAIFNDPIPLSGFSMGPNTAYCSGGSATVSLLGSELGSNYLVKYQLYLNGTAVGSTINGTGGQLNWTGITSTGNYTVSATNFSTGCTKAMSGTTVVSVNALPTDFAVSGTGLTCGATPILTMAGSQVGVNYTLMNSGNAQQAARAGTGTSMNWTLAAFIFAPYTINAVDATTGCARTMSGSATVVAPSYPQDFTVSGGGDYCTGGSGVSITLSNSQNGASYQLLRDGTPVGTPLTGPFIPLTWSNVTGSGLYTVRASRTGNCDAIMSGSATVTARPLPALFTFSGGGAYCTGSSVSITLSGSEPNVSYQIINPGGGGGAILTRPAGQAITWSGLTTPGTYSIVGTDNVYSCQQTMTASASFVPVSVKPQPTVAITPASQSICTGQATTYTISNPNNLAGTTFSWTQTSSNVSGAANGTGAAISQTLTNVSNTANGTVTYVATATTNGCTSSTASATTTVKPTPTVTGGTATIMSGAPLNFTATSNLAPATIGWNAQVTSGTATAYSASGTGAITDSPQNKGLSNATIAYHLTATVNGCSSAIQDYVVTVTDQNMNYQRQNVMQVAGITQVSQVDALPNTSVMRGVSYFDGLGRPLQTIQTQGSPQQQDVVTPAVYDAFGRETIKLLPVAVENGGRYKPGLVNAQNQYSVNFYNGGSPKVASDLPYAVTVIEPTPMHRVIKQGAPGASWQPNGSLTDFSDHVVKKVYDTNGSGEVYQFNYNATTGLVSFQSAAAAYYPAAQLTLEKTLDEKNNEVIEYKDKLGHVVCKKVQYGTNLGVKQYASTYYIYDDLGNLVVVLPPEGVKALGAQ